MKDHKIVTTGLASLIGAGFSLGVGAATVDSSANPFQLNDLGSGYQLAAQEGTCGSSDDKSGGEGQCGANEAGGSDKTEGEGKCAANDKGDEEKKSDEGKCGEVFCGSDNA